MLLPIFSKIVPAPTAQTLRLLDFSESSMPNGARWNEVLLKAQPGDIFAIDICSHQSYRRYYLVDRHEVIEVRSALVNEAYRGLLDLLKIPYDCEQGMILDRPWRNVLDPLGS